MISLSCIGIASLLLSLLTFAVGGPLEARPFLVDTVGTFFLLFGLVCVLIAALWGRLASRCADMTIEGEPWNK